jgi:hypothetical protein
VESDIVIELPAPSIADFSSLIAATREPFWVVVNADKSLAFVLISVRSDLHSVAIRVAKSVMRACNVDIV